VVIAIIGLISSVVLSSLNTARAKSRDAKRLSDFTALRSALALYASDNNGNYPSSGGGWRGVCPGFGGHSTTGAGGYIPSLAPTYISVLPTDPKPIGTGNCYLYNSNGIDYMLLAYMTVETYTTSVNRWVRPIEPNSPEFAFYTPGATNW
jgi:type II secretory pathway pseudopilin PulG